MYTSQTATQTSYGLVVLAFKRLLMRSLAIFNYPPLVELQEATKVMATERASTRAEIWIPNEEFIAAHYAQYAQMNCN